MPLASNVHVDAALTNFALARPGQKYVADAIFPLFQVSKKSDKFYIFDNAQEYQRATDDAVDSRSKTREVDFSVSTSTYDAAGHGLKDFISSEDAKNADDVFNLRADITQFLIQKVSVNKEVLAKSALDSALTGSQTAAAASGGWNGGGSPISDINTGIEAIEDNGGVSPNVMVMDSKTWNALRDHADIVERVTSSGNIGNENPANITTRGLAVLFGLEDVVVTSCVKNTAVDGQTASTSRVWSDDAYLAHSPRNASVRNFSCGKSFVWVGEDFQNQNGFVVDRWLENDPQGEYIRALAYYDQKVTASSAGYRISNCIQ